MIAAIMQPYFFPYIGYFQLMDAVDIFIIYDDVQFKKNGWINRNRILSRNTPRWLTLPVKHDSHYKMINERMYLCLSGIDILKNELQSAYADAPQFTTEYSFICNLLDFNNSNVALFNANLLRIIARKLGITCNFILSSDIDKPSDLRGEQKVISLCKIVGATSYVNAIGGVNLYDNSRFANAGLQLSFLHTTAKPIHFDSQDIHLSIIDSLMRSSLDKCKATLSQYELLPAE